MNPTPADTKPNMHGVFALHFGDMTWVPNKHQAAIILENEPTLKMVKRKPKLFILRGHPGSGKKTIALTMLQEGLADIIHQQDHFFVDNNGVYRYDASKVEEAVKYCYEHVMESLQKGLRVVVANNFTKTWTVEKYIETAKRFGAEVVVMRAMGRYQNNTGVPPEQVKKLISLYEPFPGEITI